MFCFARDKLYDHNFLTSEVNECLVCACAAWMGWIFEYPIEKTMKEL